MLLYGRHPKNSASPLLSRLLENSRMRTSSSLQQIEGRDNQDSL